MQITPESLVRLLFFMEKTATETYPEAPSSFHNEVTLSAMEYLFANFRLPSSASILDVGCGQGVALRPLQERGHKPVGITLNETDAKVCRTLGFDVRVMDQSFLDFDDASFDLVWARHVIEHSFMPYYTLTEFRRVLRPGGLLYLEVPSPDTLGHEHNPNHYSVMGKSMWESLIGRSGFTYAGAVDYHGSTDEGRADCYWGMFALATPSGNPASAGFP